MTPKTHKATEQRATVADALRIEKEGPPPPPSPTPPLHPLVKRILDEFAENEAREYAEGNTKSADLWRRAAAIVEVTARRWGTVPL